MTPRIAYSHFEKDYLRELIQESYDEFVSGSFDLRLFNAGFNVVYHVWTDEGGSYMFRIRPTYDYYEINADTVDFVLGFQEHLRSHSFPVPRVLKTSNDTYFGKIDAPEGPRYYSIHEVVSGESIFPLTPDQSFQLGKYLASMHLLGDKYQPKTNRLYFTYNRMIEEPRKLLDRYPDAFSGNNSWFRDIIEKIGELLQKEQLDDLVIIHGDFWHGNVLFEENKPMINFIDFDFACHAPKEFDLASFLILGYQRIITSPEDFPKVDQMFDDLIRGYHDVWEDAIDLDLVYLIALARTCWMIGGYFTVIGIQAFASIQKKIKNLTTIFKQLIQKSNYF